jgi:hypothetical protein
MDPFYGLMADIIVVVHLGVVIFNVGGELAILAGWAFRWQWVRNLTFRVTHVLLVVFVAVTSLLGMLCPLTTFEYRLRVMAGQRTDGDISFVARLVRAIIFYEAPAWAFIAAYVAFALLVVVTMICVRPERRRGGSPLSQP